MLAAQKNYQLTDLSMRSLGIRQKELSFWTSIYGVIASQSAFILGVSFSGISVASDAGPASWYHGMAHSAYLLCTTGAVGCGLITVMTAFLSAALAPGMALRGQFGSQSVHMAVDTLNHESVGCYNFFLLQLAWLTIALFCFEERLHDIRQFSVKVLATARISSQAVETTVMTLE